MVNLLARDGRRVSESDVGVGCDDLGKLTDGKSQSAIIIPLAQIRDHLAADIADFCVVEDALKSIADLDAVFAVVDGEQDEDAFIGAFLADFPSVFKLVGVLGGVIAVEIADGNDGDLGVGGGVVELAANAVELGYGLGGEDMGVVADVAGGTRETFDGLRQKRGQAIHEEAGKQ